jgi:hypothetical protein
MIDADNPFPYILPPPSTIVTQYPKKLGDPNSGGGGVLSPGVKLTTHLHIMSDFENMWSYNSTPQYVFMAR